jgi:glycosyltransferase involved in cell wall biosynthesis
MIRVIALVPYPERRAPGQRFRIEQWAPLMREEGVELTISPFLDAHGMDVLYQRGRAAAKIASVLRGHGRRARQIRALNGFDAAYVYREAALGRPAWMERAVAKRLPIVYDFDDAIYLPAASAANVRMSFLKNPGKPATLCRLAAHVTVGNDHLAAFARRHAQQVTVIPSTIDTEKYVPRARPPAARPVIGWTGSPTTLPYLLAMLPALRQLRTRIDFELRVIGGTLADAALDITNVPWRAETEVEDLRAFDVGLMPLADDEWARGKCGMKALQYMALGIPPVVSPVGINTAIVRHGVNGMHAGTDEEWVARIEELGRDPELRARLGREARRTVVAEYSAAVHAPRMAQVLRDAATRRKTDR